MSRCYKDLQINETVKTKMLSERKVLKIERIWLLNRVIYVHRLTEERKKLKILCKIFFLIWEGNNKKRTLQSNIHTSLNLIMLGCFKALWFIISLCTCSSICIEINPTRKIKRTHITKQENNRRSKEKDRRIHSITLRPLSIYLTA